MPAPAASRPALDVSAVRLPGWRVELLESSPSTNAVVSARAITGELPGLVVVTEHQTAGRGRLTRTWVTPPRAALTFSLLIEPRQVPFARWPWLPLLTGLAVVDGVRRAAGLEVALKWPNDVLAEGGGKVAGILVERVERPPTAMAVVGIGINVSSTPEELPVPTATSLAIAGATSLDRTALLREVLASFSGWYDGWVGALGQGLRAPYSAACSTLGRTVRVDLPSGSLHGRAVGVDDAGRLLVDDGGRVHTLGAGDVVHVRPA